jgi:hypothetical protein
MEKSPSVVSYAGAAAPADAIVSYAEIADAAAGVSVG